MTTTQAIEEELTERNKFEVNGNTLRLGKVSEFGVVKRFGHPAVTKG